MFTRCPSCHTEISFDAPKNAPAGYKHRIKCPNPNCGVTISVVIPPRQNTVDQQTAQSANNYSQRPVGGVGQQYPPYPPQYPPYGYAPYNGYTPQPYPQAPPYPYPQQQPVQEEQQEEEVTSRKWTGSVAKSLVLLFIGLGVVLFHVLGYLLTMGTLTLPNSAGLENFVGITYLELLITFGADIFRGTEIVSSVFYLLGVVQFFLACIMIIFNIFIASFKAYGKGAGITNIVFSALIFLVFVATAVEPYISLLLSNGPQMDFGSYFKMIATVDMCTLLVGVALGLLLFVLSIVFFFLKAQPISDKTEETENTDPFNPMASEAQNSEGDGKKQKRAKKEKKKKSKDEKGNAEPVDTAQ